MRGSLDGFSVELGGFAARAMRSNFSAPSTRAPRGGVSDSPLRSFMGSTSALLGNPLESAIAADDGDIDGTAHGFLLRHDTLLEDVERHKFARGIAELRLARDLQHPEDRVDERLLLVLRDHVIERLEIARHEIALEALAHAIAHRGVGVAEGTHHLVHQPVHHHAETAIDAPFEIEIDAADEGVGHFAVRKDTDLGAYLAIDGIDARFRALHNTAHHSRDEAGDDRGIEVL